MTVVKLNANLWASKERGQWQKDALTKGGELGILYEDVEWGNGRPSTYPSGPGDCRDIMLFDPIDGASWVFESSAHYKILSPLELLAREAE
jgi:hypothetical protein